NRPLTSADRSAALVDRWRLSGRSFLPGAAEQRGQRKRFQTSAPIPIQERALWPRVNWPARGFSFPSPWAGPFPIAPPCETASKAGFLLRRQVNDGEESHEHGSGARGSEDRLDRSRQDGTSASS